LVAFLLLGILAQVAAGEDKEKHPFGERPQLWTRRAEPVLSAYTTKESWCKVVVYSPHVIFHDGRFRMWYLGTSAESRTNDIVLGYAESTDGRAWTPFDSNPILTADDIPWGHPLQTPFVMYDSDDLIYKMWFVSGRGITRDDQGGVLENDQRLGYAVSSDGIRWKVHPQSLYPSARSPSVIKEGPKNYRMWMGSSPSPEHPWNELYKHIYEFKSTDGIHWMRGEKPVIEPSGRLSSTVYPFVLKEGKTFYMWYGGHLAGGMFEIFCATSQDGTHWQTDHEHAAFAAAAGKKAFDSRYTSTPCVLKQDNRYLLFYSARDWKTEYIDAQGRKRIDKSSPYAHIGVAEIPELRSDR
jgi:predicted GH43/DUF377 family glycosyl hydrolase